MGGISAIDALLSVIQDPRDIGIKTHVAAALLALDDARTAPPLIKYLKNEPDSIACYQLFNPNSLQ
jgi:HEAT repeat protein